MAAIISDAGDYTEVSPRRELQTDLLVKLVCANAPNASETVCDIHHSNLCVLGVLCGEKSPGFAKKDWRMCDKTAILVLEGIGL
jgi:hypothetical protein